MHDVVRTLRLENNFLKLEQKRTSLYMLKNAMTSKRNVAKLLLTVDRRIIWQRTGNKHAVILSNVMKAR